MATKYYAVLAGREKGIFTTWAECAKNVTGYSGATYKSFLTLAEAETFMKDKQALSVSRADNGAKRSSAVSKIKSNNMAAGRANSQNNTTSFDIEADYIIYTDGSCLVNPGGAGGWAVVAINTKTGEAAKLSGGAKETTNNRMELQAAIEALKYTPTQARIALFTDSQYLKNAFTKGWLNSWKRRNWRKADGTAVLNQDLWTMLDELFSSREVTFHWVKGHAGNDYNELCDELARQRAIEYQSMA